MLKFGAVVTLAILSLGNAFTVISHNNVHAPTTMTSLHMAKKLTKEQDLAKTVETIMAHVDKDAKRAKPKERSVESVSAASVEEGAPMKKRDKVKRALGKIVGGNKE